VLAQFRKQALQSGRLAAETLQEPDAQLIDKLHLSDGHYLKRAALLLFHADAERFVTGAYLKLGFFENNVDLRYQDEVHGDLFTQVSQAMMLLQTKYLKAWISYEGLQRIESFAVPDAALREALLNAVVHKDYAVPVPIQISVYPEKLMIWNPGQLPQDWTLSKLLGKHASLPFNPEVANAFFRAGWIESWGRGIERIQLACQQAGTPAPELSLDHGGLWVTFHFPPAVAQVSEEALGG
jgi:ATP-dependent DNA helicase RecG